MSEQTARGRVAIVAGSGQIPVFVAEKLEKDGRRPFIIAVDGEADPALLKYEHQFVYSAHIGVLLSALRRIKPEDVVLIGGAKSRPSLWRIRPDWTTIRLAARMIPKLRSGDDVLLRGVINMIEDAGFRVRGVHELVPDLLAEKGNLAGPKPSRTAVEAIATAVDGALALGGLDAGQACVAIGRRIVALEGAEGTDMMLQRVAELRAAGRLPKRRGGVLVKLAKPRQDLRSDLPTIGVSTVENAAKAALSGIAVHAEHALIADQGATFTRASALGVFIVGIDPAEYRQGGAV
jgi:UDP-2,3-diacylglucosamine hydrolase